MPRRGCLILNNPTRKPLEFLGTDFIPQFNHPRLVILTLSQLYDRRAPRPDNYCGDA